MKRLQWLTLSDPVLKWRSMHLNKWVFILISRQFRQHTVVTVITFNWMTKAQLLMLSSIRPAAEVRWSKTPASVLLYRITLFSHYQHKSTVFFKHCFAELSVNSIRSYTCCDLLRRNIWKFEKRIYFCLFLCILRLPVYLYPLLTKLATSTCAVYWSGPKVGKFSMICQIKLNWQCAHTNQQFLITACFNAFTELWYI